jgi:hypothetical protein
MLIAMEASCREVSDDVASPVTLRLAMFESWFSWPILRKWTLAIATSKTLLFRQSLS